MKVYSYDYISKSYVHAGMSHYHLHYMNTIFLIAKHMDKYRECGRPYLLHHYLTTDLNYVMLMSPWMMEKFSHADYIEIDVTFNVTAEFQYLLNAVTFDYSTCKCTDDYLSIHTFTNVCKH